MTPKRFDTDMPKDGLTVHLDPEVAQALRVAAVRRKMKDSELVEEALRDKLGFTFMEESWELNADLTEEEAMELALEAQCEMREKRRREQAPS